MVSKGLCGYSGRYFSVRKSDSMKGLSSLTLGRLKDATMPSWRRRREHRRALHRAAVIGVQHETAWVNALRRARRAHECGRRLHRLFFVHLEADDAAAPDVLDEVEIEEATADRAEEVRDVPAPHLVRCRRDVLVDGADRARLRATAVGVLPFVAKDAVDRRLRSDVTPGVREARNDLFRRQIAIVRRVHDLEHLRALRGREGVRGARARAGAEIVADVRFAPTLHRAVRKTDDFTRLFATRAGVDRLVDHGEDHFSFSSSVSLSLSSK